MFLDQFRLGKSKMASKWKSHSYQVIICLIITKKIWMQFMKMVNGRENPPFNKDLFWKESNEPTPVLKLFWASLTSCVIHFVRPHFLGALRPFHFSKWLIPQIHNSQNTTVVEMFFLAVLLDFSKRFWYIQIDRSGFPGIHKSTNHGNVGNRSINNKIEKFIRPTLTDVILRSF